MSRASTTQPPTPDLDAETASLLRQVPAGSVTTYGDLAEALGDRKASPYVGQFMLHHPHATDCPCHRVVRADGQLGKYISGSEQEKATRLNQEGISVESGRVPLTHRWSDFQSDFPLQVLRSYQDRVAQNIDLTPRALDLSWIAGVDVSFVPQRPLAVASLTVFDTDTQQLSYWKTHRRGVDFPYISGYLAFRELPVLRELLDIVRAERRLPDVVMVDGSGILHPRRCGIATMLGVEQHLSTVGVTKKHLFGQREYLGDESSARIQQVTVNHVTAGYAVRIRASSQPKFLYVSPGSNIDLSAVADVIDCSFLGRRLPEPIYWADRISRQAARQT